METAHIAGPYPTNNAKYHMGLVIQQTDIIITIC